jgi:hypothetical protein
MFLLIELLEPVELPPQSDFKVVFADVAPRQLAYVMPCQP